MSSFSWNDVMDEHLPKHMQQKLLKATIGIAGAGGLGSNCATLLTRTGIGNLIIVDHDIVALSNLNRQQYLKHHIGIPKVQALRQILVDINPNIQIKTHQCYMQKENILTFFSNCSIVVEAVDNALTKKLLVETLASSGHIVISASGIAGWGKPMQKQHIGNKIVVVGDQTYPVSSTNPPLAPRVNIAASMQADAVLCALLKE